MPATPALGIDFGTSNTTAVLRRSDGRVETVMFDGSPLLPSAVFAETDGTILVGRDAIDSARLDPARFEPHPKRRVDDGTVLLGDHEIQVAELFTAVLERVRRECEQLLGALPPTVVLTHPAAWGPTRRLVLEDAARAAGLPESSLVPEPVAAAAYYVAELGNRIAVGSAAVVHDFGGGTFDASVVRRTPDGFEVLALDGLDDLGGRDIDQAIVGRLRESVGTESEWERLLRPATAADRRLWRTFHDDVRAAKERLSRHSSADLFIPVLDREIHLTRDELETLTAPLLARAPGIVKGVIRASGLPDSAIAGVFLVGGASRMPLVATTLHRELGRPPTVIDRLDQVVAHGTLLTGATASAPAPPEPYQPVPPQPYTPIPEPQHTPERPVRPRAAYPILGVFASGAAILPPLTIDMYLPGLPAIAAMLGTSDTAAQLTISSFLIGAVVALLATRPLSDRVGRRRPLLAGTALFALSSLAAALAPDIATLIGARFAQGLAGAGCMVLFRAVLHDRSTGPRLDRSIAVLGATLGAASVTAPILGAAVTDALSWRTVFVILAAIGLIACAAVLLGVSETLPAEDRHRRGSARVRMPLHRGSIGIALTAAFSSAALFVYLAGSSFVFMHHFGLSPGMYGLVLATNAAAVLTGAAVVAARSSKGRPASLLYAATAVAVAGALLLLLTAVTGSANVSQIWASLFLVLLGLGGMTPAALAVTKAPAPGATQPSALIAGLSCLLGAIAAPLSGLLGAASVERMAMAMLTALALAAAATTLTAGRTTPQSKELLAPANPE